MDSSNGFEIDALAPPDEPAFYLDDRRLSWGARGMLAFMLEQLERHGRVPTAAELREAGPDGVRVIRRHMAELRECGYLSSAAQYPVIAHKQNEFRHVSRRVVGGYIYLFFWPTTGLYKIGMSKDTYIRFVTLERRYPGLRHLAHYWVADMEHAEWEMHQSLSDYRVKGEWFALPEIETDRFARACVRHSGYAASELWEREYLPER